MRSKSNLDYEHIEPRIVRLETGFEALSNNVNELTNTLREHDKAEREHDSKIEGQIESLAISVSQAAGPRKTDWGVIISALALILALGAAVFAPLNMQMIENKNSINENTRTLNDHLQLPMHKVGEARLDGIEKAILLRDLQIVKSLDGLDTKLQREFTLLNDTTKESIKNLDVRLQLEANLASENIDKRTLALKDDMKLMNDRNEGRLKKLEDWIVTRSHDEYTEWRQERATIK